MRIARSIAVIGVTTIAVFGLTACGDDSDPKPSSSTATEQAAETEGSGDNADSGSSSEMADWMSAVKKNPTYRITMDMGSQGTMKGVADLTDPDNPKMALDMESSGQTIKMIVIGDKTYINMGQLTQNKYYVTDASDRTDGLSDSLSGMDLEATKDAVTSIEKKGSPITLDGVSAQPYEVTVDTSKIEALQDTGTAGATSQLPATIVYTYYVGPDNLPRRQVYSVGGTEFTMDFSDWGAKSDIQAPAASEITENPFTG